MTDATKLTAALQKYGAHLHDDTRHDGTKPPSEFCCRCFPEYKPDCHCGLADVLREALAGEGVSTVPCEHGSYASSCGCGCPNHKLPAPPPPSAPPVFAPTHQPVPHGYGSATTYCSTCFVPWPCASAQEELIREQVREDIERELAKAMKCGPEGCMDCGADSGFMCWAHSRISEAFDRRISSHPWLVPVPPKRFPIQPQRGAEIAAYPLTIPWSIAEEAYSVYYARYGGEQTLERLAQRGGFGPSEMDGFLPGWRERADRVTAAEAEASSLRQKLEAMKETLTDEVGENLRIAERIGIMDAIKAGKSYHDAEIELFDSLRQQLEKATAERDREWCETLTAAMDGAGAPICNLIDGREAVRDLVSDRREAESDRDRLREGVSVKPLTEEELAFIESQLLGGTGHSVARAGGRRILAALRAAEERIRTLERELQEAKAETERRITQDDYLWGMDETRKDAKREVWEKAIKADCWWCGEGRPVQHDATEAGAPLGYWWHDLDTGKVPCHAGHLHFARRFHSARDDDAPGTKA